MLREIEGVHQDEPALRRRWFHDDDFDLFLWQREDGTVTAFELCYGASGSECALVWREGDGFYHDGTPPQTAAGDASGADAMRERFNAAAAQLPVSLRDALDQRLAEYLAIRDRLTTRRKRFRRADWQQTR